MNNLDNLPSGDPFIQRKPKSPLKSKGVSGSLLVIGPALIKLFMEYSATGSVPAGEALFLVEIIIAGSLALWGRLKADRPINFKL